MGAELIVDARVVRNEAGMANDYYGPRAGRARPPASRRANADLEEYEVVSCVCMCVPVCGG